MHYKKWHTQLLHFHWKSHTHINSPHKQFKVFLYFSHNHVTWYIIFLYFQLSASTISINPIWFSDPQTWIPVQQHCPVARGNRSHTIWIGNDNRTGHWHIAKGHQRKGKTVAIKPENIKTNSKYTFFHGTTGCQSNFDKKKSLKATTEIFLTFCKEVSPPCLWMLLDSVCRTQNL